MTPRIRLVTAPTKAHQYVNAISRDACNRLILLQTCYNCGQQGHLSRECTEPAKDKVRPYLRRHVEKTADNPRPATAAAKLDTCPVTARLPLLVAVQASAPVVVAVARSATSAARSATSHATAPRVVRTADSRVARLATHAVVLAT